MHTLPPGLTFALSLEGRPVVLDELLEAPRDESIRRDPKVGDLNGFGSNTAILGKGLDNDTNDPTRRGFDTKPQVIFYASGDVSPYHLELRREAEPESWTIDQAIDGTIKALSPSQRALQLTGGP